ncbi:MAG: hypothetical protein JW910_16650 [Anaerolineae bacterium]|nr:hypothetical protein [Anaerolineae bacterium]
MANFQQLAITGYEQQPVPNRFFQPVEHTGHLAVLLPGLNYTAQMPLLYYPAQLLLSLGADVLQVNYDYPVRPGYRSLSEEERDALLHADADAALRAGLAQADYTRLTLLGKSIGTLALGRLLAGSGLPEHTQAVWLTPLLANNHAYADLRQATQHGLFVMGTTDPYYDPARWQELRAQSHTDMVLIEGADHGLNLAGNVPGSVDALGRVMRAMQHFLTDTPLN